MSGYYLKRWVGTVGELTLFEFNVNDAVAKDIARLFRQNGLSATATQIRKNFDYLGAYMLTGLAEGALESVQRCIPWDSEELFYVHTHVEEATESNPVSRVYIDGEGHLGSKRKLEEEASGLAMFLDKPVGPNDTLHRSNPAQGGTVGPLTDDWIADAQLDFQARKDAILKGLI